MYVSILRKTSARKALHWLQYWTGHRQSLSFTDLRQSLQANADIAPGNKLLPETFQINYTYKFVIHAALQKHVADTA
jgi:hypothetical protein